MLFNDRAGCNHQMMSATPAAVQWCILGPNRSAKRSLFFAGSGRRPDPIVQQETISSLEQSADGSNRQRNESVPSGVSQFGRSMSMRVRSSRNAKSSCEPDGSVSQRAPTVVRPLAVILNLFLSGVSMHICVQSAVLL